jgi:hypothetical protein
MSDGDEHFYTKTTCIPLSKFVPSHIIVAQSFDGSDPSGVRCISDCQCQYLTGSTGRCLCDADDGTDPDDCPFTDPSTIDPRTTLPPAGDDDDGSGKGKGKGTDGKGGKGKRRELTKDKDKKAPTSRPTSRPNLATTTVADKTTTKKKKKTSGDDDDDGPSPTPRPNAIPTAPPSTDRGGVDVPFGAFCCDCECVKKPCACECFGYGPRDDGSIPDGDDDDDDDGGKGGKGKGSTGKGGSKVRKTRETEEAAEDVQDEDDGSHVRSRMSRGYQADTATPDAAGTGWKSWVYNSIWSSSNDVEDDSTDPVNRELTTATRKQVLENRKKKKKKTVTGDDDDDNGGNTGPTTRPRSTPTAPPRSSPTNPPVDGGSVCERPPYTCTYVKFHPGTATCNSRKFCKANTFGYCEMQTRIA